MIEKPDAALVAEAAAGDQDAFCVLVRRYQNHAYGTAIGILSDFDLAQDVVQEVFLSAYLSLGKLKDPERFGGWLRGIVRNTAYKALREQQQARALVEAYGQTAREAAPAPSVDQAMVETERLEVVRRTLERLEPKNREVVGLYYADGLSYEDIAEFLGVTRATVKGRLQRGRAQLREEVEMVQKTFKDQQLPDDFAAEVKSLLEKCVSRGHAFGREIDRLIKIGSPAVSALCEALDHPRSGVRSAAARALSGIADPRSLEPVVEALKAERLNIRKSGRLLAIPGLREALMRVAREGQSNEQYWALNVLGSAEGDRKAFDCVYEIFRTPGPHQATALFSLMNNLPEWIVGVVAQALRSSDPRIRRGAVWMALHRGLRPPLDACLKAFLLGTMNSEALILSHGETGEQALDNLLRNGSPGERIAAAMALACKGAQEVFEILTQELTREPANQFLAAFVSNSLAWHYGAQFSTWIEANASRLTHLSSVLWAVAKSPSPQASPLIEKLARKAAPSVHAAAIRILAKQKGNAAIPELRRRLRECRPGKAAREAFRQMFRLHDAAVSTARDMLTSEHWPERKAAVALLRRWGKLSPKQACRLINDPHVAVRDAAGPWPKPPRHKATSAG